MYDNYLLAAPAPPDSLDLQSLQYVMRIAQKKQAKNWRGQKWKGEGAFNSSKGASEERRGPNFFFKQNLFKSTVKPSWSGKISDQQQ